MKKIIKSIEILGLENNLSDISLNDGTCEVLHNLRNNRGEWVNCSHLTKIADIKDTSHIVIHKHIVLAYNEYITLVGGSIYHSRLNNNGLFIDIKLLTSINPILDYCITSHENALHITQKDAEIIKDEIFLYDKQSQTYGKIDVNDMVLPTISVIKYNESYSETEIIDDSINLRSTRIAVIKRNKVNRDIIESSEFFYNTHLQNQIKGTFLFFIGYKMFDGSILKVSNVIKFSGEENDYYIRKIKDVGTQRIDTFYKILKSISPQIEITVDENFKSSKLFTKIGVYATRNVPELDYAKVGCNWDSLPYKRTIISNNDVIINEIYNKAIINLESEILSNTPFYEIAELDKNELQIKLSYEEHFKTIESSPIYKASFSQHKRYSSNKLYYNSRLHEFDLHFSLAKLLIKLPTDVYRSWSDTNYGNVSPINIAGAIFEFRVTLNIESKEYVVLADTQQAIMYTINSINYIRLPKYIAYQDFRATAIYIYIKQGGECKSIFSSPLISAQANNLSYTNISTELIPLNTCIQAPIKAVFDSYSVDNLIYVSNIDNMFFFNPKYTINANKEPIKRLALSIDQLDFSKFGDNPMYIFTEKGIYIAETGSGEILYSRVLPINFNAAIGKTPIISLNGALVYITEGGISVIQGKNSSIISKTLHDRGNKFINYIKKCDFAFFNQTYDELLFYNSAHNYAYIYSMQSKSWSTREFSKMHVVNSSLVANEKGLYNTSITEDYTMPLSCRFVTHPLKLGNFEYKRIDVVIARLVSQNYTFKIEGSNDMNIWEIINIVTTYKIRRALQSYKYYKIEINSLNCQTTISQIDIQYYDRFTRNIK